MGSLTKEEIRKNILTLRDEMDASYRAESDLKIREKIIDLIKDHKPGTVLTYVSFRSEPDTHGLIEELLKTGIRVAVPKVEKPEITFYHIESFDDLIPGYMGILEPAQNLNPWKEADVSLGRGTDMILVPGSVFDLKNNRIGYGGGYYDRFLGRYPDLYSVGLAYRCQIIERIPSDEWDVPLDMVVTER